MRNATVSVFLPQGALDYAALKQRARDVEALGYEGLWLVDHMWARGAPDVDFLEGWTTITALAEATERLRLGVLVTCNSYRNPGILAKIVATADHVSGGRIELGLGAGWMEEEYRAYGFEFPPLGVRLAQLGESLAIVRSLFEQPRTTYEGRYYRFADAPFEPKPLQRPLPITLGGAGPRVMMKLVARYAQRWNCPMPAAGRLAEHLEALERHCQTEGRPRSEIAISEQVAVVLAADETALRGKRELAQMLIGGFVDLDTMAVCGTPDQVAAALHRKQAAGVEDFAVLFGDLGMPETLELFAREVLPALTGG